jgi:hypothetical protein
VGRLPTLDADGLITDGDRTAQPYGANPLPEPAAGRAGKAELLTGIEAASSRPVRRIVLRAG